MRPRTRPMHALATVAFALVAGCSSVAPVPDPSVESSVPADFAFIRDEIRAFPPGQVRQAEEQLRAIAEATGVYGVVVATDRLDDPPEVIGPIVEEVGELGGRALVAICTPDDCELRQARGFSAELQDAAVAVAPEPVPAGQRGGGGPRGLRAWIEYVAAVAGWQPAP